MTDKTPLETAVENALDAFVYAPIGLLFDGANLFPKLVESGKTQVNSARMFGKFAVQGGQAEAAKRAEEAQGQLKGVLGQLGILPTETAPEPATTTPAPEPEPEPEPEPVAEETPPAPDAEELSIPDYDSLSASQVVQRLAGLAAAELEGVRRYELAKRARKTILNKITQLQK